VCHKINTCVVVFAQFFMPINTEPDIHELVLCANVFVRKADKYLVIKRSPQKKFLPGVVQPIGGKVDLNENPYVAAQREVFEEAGITVKNLRLEAVILDRPVPEVSPNNWLVFQFSADYDAGEITETEEGELVWLSAEELQAAPLFASVRKVLHHILNPSDGTVFATFPYINSTDIDDAQSTIDIGAR
jgi:8-oxo-dGTP pyrophosphatase MutT (NUDIX family)